MTQTKGDRTRARIIEGAIRSLSTVGVVGTSMRKIAAEAGVYLATLHYHFDSKSELLLAVFGVMMDDFAVAMRDAGSQSASLDDCIADVLRSAWRLVEATRVLQIVQYELTLYAVREGSEWLAEQQYDAFIRLYRDPLWRVSKATRRLSPTGCTFVARFMLAGVDGIILQELAKPGRARSRRSVEALIVATQAYARTLGAEPAP